MQFIILVFLALGLACVSPSGPSSKVRVEHLGFTFPASIGELHLQSFHEYDDPLYGAVANYRLTPTDPLIVSVYIFPAPHYPDGSIQPIDGHAEDELRGLLRHYEGSQQIQWPEELAYKNPAEREVYQAALEIQHVDLGRVYSLLALTTEGPSRIKFRISYVPHDVDAAFAVRTFFEQFP